MATTMSVTRARWTPVMDPRRTPNVDQSPGQPVGAGVEFGVGQSLRPGHQGECARGLLRLFLENLMYAAGIGHLRSR
jgi:hypothetical protein